MIIYIKQVGDGNEPAGSYMYSPGLGKRHGLLNKVFVIQHPISLSAEGGKSPNIKSVTQLHSWLRFGGDCKEYGWGSTPNPITEKKTSHHESND